MSEKPIYDGEMSLEELEDAARLVLEHGPEDVKTAAYQVAYHLSKIIARLRHLYGENEGLKIVCQGEHDNWVEANENLRMANSTIETQRHCVYCDKVNVNCCHSCEEKRLV